MKINGPGSIKGVLETAKAQRPKAGASPMDGPAAKVSVSGDAAWIAALQFEASQISQVRQDVVAETRAQLEAGTFEQTVDMEALVGNLLADL